MAEKNRVRKNRSAYSTGTTASATTAVSDYEGTEGFVNKKQLPLAIQTFRGYFSEEYTIPEVASKRKCTDVFFLFIMAIFLIAMIGIVAYNLTNSDYARYTNGYDECGNVCGRRNKKIKDIACTGVDHTKNTKLLISEIRELLVTKKYYPWHNNNKKPKHNSTEYTFECVENCNASMTEVSGKCFLLDNQLPPWDVALAVLDQCVVPFLVMVAIALALSMIVLFCFRCNVRCTCYVVLALCMVSSVAMGAFFIYKYTQEHLISYIITGGLMLFVPVGLLLTLYCLSARLSITFMLFEEAFDILAEMPCIFLQPLVTLIAEGILITCLYFGITALLTVGDLKQIDSDTYRYKVSTFAIVAMVLLVFAGIWLYCFIKGCQTFIIGYSMSALYFRRDRSKTSSSILTAYAILIRYHLGSIAFGSLMVAIITIIRALYESLVNNNREDNFCLLILKCIGSCLLACIQSLLELLVGTGYMVIAMHGRALCKSAVRGIRLIYANFINFIAIGIVGSLITGTVTLLVVAVSVGIGCLVAINNEAVDYYFWIPLGFGVLFTFEIPVTICSLMMSSIDAVFLCFCEDKAIHDETLTPYFMSSKLQKAVSEALEMAEKGLKKRNGCC